MTPSLRLLIGGRFSTSISHFRLLVLFLMQPFCEFPFICEWYAAAAAAPEHNNSLIRATSLLNWGLWVRVWNVIQFDVWCASQFAIDVCIKLSRWVCSNKHLNCKRIFNYLNTWNLVRVDRQRFGLSTGSVNGIVCMAPNVVNCARIEPTTTDGNRMQTDYPIIAMHECEAFHWIHHVAMQLCCCCSMSCRWREIERERERKER